MNDGGDGQNSSKRRGNDFGRAISKIAVTQICESVGFQSSHRSALDALADVAVRYISDLGKAAKFYAELSGRSDPNAFDAIQGLKDLGSSHGFIGASDAQLCLVSSGIVRDINDYVRSEKELSFPCPVPGFPIPRPSIPRPSIAQVGETPAGKHIPDWLPPFPGPHTLTQTKVSNERATTDPRADKLEQGRERRKAERSLLRLQRRLASNSASGFVTTVNDSANKGKAVVAVSNPFLAPPLPYGEKEVSEIAVRNDSVSGKRPSVLEAFMPAIEAAKDGFVDSGVGEKRIFHSGRPKINFKFGIDKKSVAVPLNSGALGVKTDSWFLRDDEKDDKKRRAEMILKEAMENSEELSQL